MGSWVRSDMRSQILSYLAITLKGIFFPTNPLKKTVRNFSVICGAVGDGFMSANLWFDRKRLWRGKCGQMGWSYGNQAVILQAWGRLEEAMALLKKQEALCLELGNRRELARCYWTSGLLARELRDHKTEREKLAAALDLFSELDMARERDAVRAELETTIAAKRAT